jgi:hypothetical protein
MEEQHLAPLCSDEDSSFDNYNSSDDDSSVEITSTIDECENELVRLSTYLQLESEDDNDDDQTFEWPAPPPSLLFSSSSDDELNDSQPIVLSTTSNANVDIQEKSMKRKRRQWTVKEKLDAIALFDKNQSKRETAKKEGCTTAQLRNWIKNKENLFKMYKKKKGSFLFFFILDNGNS